MPSLLRGVGGGLPRETDGDASGLTSLVSLHDCTISMIVINITILLKFIGDEYQLGHHSFSCSC